MNEPRGVVVEMKRDGERGQVFFTGAKSLPELRFDFTPLTKEEINGEHLGARLLLCAALACYTNTFANTLSLQGVKIHSLSAQAEIEKEKDEIFRTKYTHITLHMTVGVEEGDGHTFERVREDMERGSLLTYSLAEGIEVTYDVRMA